MWISKAITLKDITYTYSYITYGQHGELHYQVYVISKQVKIIITECNIMGNMKEMGKD